MTSCAAYGCTNRPTKKIPGVSFHKFPKDEVLKAEWVKAVRRGDWTPSKFSILCSEHFHHSDFDKASMLRVYLKPNAVPSFFKAFPKYLQKERKQRRKPINYHQMRSPENAYNEEDGGEVPESMLCENNSENVYNKNSEEPEQMICENYSKIIEDGGEVPITKYLELKRMFEKAQKTIQELRKKVKILQQTERRSKKKICNLETTLKECKHKGLISDDSLEILFKAAGPNKDLLTRQICKAKNDAVKSSYSPELRKFALTLHFYSPRAYNYVRETLNFCLPHTRTISRWYQHLNIQPGFTEEAMKALRLKVESTPYPLFFSLMFDEMAIRKHVEFLLFTDT